MRIWYLLPMRAAKVQASLRIRAVSPEPPLLAHTSSESRGTFRQKARSPLDGWVCAVKICHDGMLEDTNLAWRGPDLRLSKKADCLPSIWINDRRILIKLARKHQLDTRQKWLVFGDLYPIFKVTRKLSADQTSVLKQTGLWIHEFSSENTALILMCVVASCVLWLR